MNSTQLIKDLYKANPGIDLLRLKLHDEEIVHALQTDQKLKSSGHLNHIAHLKEISRLVRLHPEAERQGKPLTAARIGELYEQFKGLGSAHEIVRKNKEQFIDEHAASFGNKETASLVYQKALQVTNNVSNLTTTVLNLTTPLAKAMVSGSVSEEITDYFQGLAGYQDLFGDLNYCDCPECRSVVGPAAYFVDLLRIIQKYVTEPNKKTIAAEMKFDSRRPDLSAIELTCENTNTVIPYLTVITQRLEALLIARWGLKDAVALYQKIADSYYPFNLPYLQPLSTVRIYLEQLKTTLAEVYQVLQISGDNLVTEQLELNLNSWKLLQAADKDPEKLKLYYGVTDLTTLSDFDIFSTQTNLLVTQVNALLYQNLSADELAAALNKNFFINQQLVNPVTISNSNDQNSIDHLDPTALDQINRFLRLSLQLDWTFEDLDWALHALNNGIPDLSSTILAQIPLLEQLTALLNATVTTSCSLIFDLKTYGSGNDQQQSSAPFDIAFNTGQNIPYHPKNSTTAVYPFNQLYTDDPWIWDYSLQTGNNPQYALRTASGLGISQRDLLILVKTIFSSDTKITLNVPNISALYRHILLAGYLKLSIEQYLIMLKLNGLVKSVFTLHEVIALLSNSAQLAVTQLNVYDIDYVVNGVNNPAVNMMYIPANTDKWLTTLPLLVTSAAIKEADKKAEMLTKLYEQLAAFFGIQPAMAQAITGLVVKDPLTVFLSPDHAESIQAITLFSKWLVCTVKTGLTEAVLYSITADFTAYSLTETTSLSFNGLLTLIDFQQFIGRFSDVNDRFTKYITVINAVKPDLEKAAAILSEATGWNKDDLITLFGQFQYTDQVNRLTLFSNLFDLENKTSLNLASLTDLALLAGKGLPDWDFLVQKAQALLSAIQARYNAGTAWDQLYVQINGKTESSQRNALMGAAIAILRQEPVTAFVKNARNLSEYLLIDTEMSASAQISSIKEGLNAAQLYLNRCKAKLEPGVEKLPIPEIWWEWMMNYRVWQANREIFLYPENYLDPAYRSSKTTLFTQLENDLKQNEITAANVTAAYTKYLESFAELAKLVYVDAYYCRVSDDTRNDQPTLFMFARTATDPYVYYYIIRESEGTWSEWKKIDLAINAANITPVYAFNRLFLFWVEKKTTVDKTPDSSTKTIVTAAINYTFYNFQNQWVPAQSLVKDYIISADPSDYRKNNAALFPDDYFDPESLWWNKVYPLKIDQDAYWDIANGGNRFEKLVIAYGPMIDTTADIKLNPNNDKPVSDNASVLQFENHLYKRRQDYSYLEGLGYEGQLPVFHPIVLNDNLDATYLVTPEEILFFTRDAAGSNQLFTPQLDSTSGQLNLISTPHTIYDNDIAQQIIYPAIPVKADKLKADSFISAAAGIDSPGSLQVYKTLQDKTYIDNQGMLLPDDNFAEIRTAVETIFLTDPDKVKKTQSVMGVINTACGSRWLSKNLRNKNYGLFTIKNASGTFVFFGDKEAFLFEDPDIDPIFISDHLYNSDTLFEPSSFISKGAAIDQTGSEAIFKGLNDYGYLSDGALLTRGSTLKDLRKDLNAMLEGQPNKPDKVDVVLDIIANTPLFYNNAFISAEANINQEGSASIFSQLTLSAYLDVNGRLTTEIDFNELTQDLYEILAGQPQLDLKVRFVVKVLYQVSYPTSIGFFQGLAASHYSCEYNFKATRLTTGAIHNLSSRIFSGGIDKLLSLESQLIPTEPELPFSRFGFKAPYVQTPEAADGAQVDFNGAYELYYWELFFHAPMYIAQLLKINQVFDAAEKWYKYIFDPTAQPYLISTDSFMTSTLGATDSQRIYQVLTDQKIVDANGYVSSTFSAGTDLGTILSFITEVQRQSVKSILLNHQVARKICRVWQFNPFRNHTVASLLENITSEKQIAAYNQYPFDPHAIARLRIGAYEKAVVMEYIDNLIKWGDWYFTQYTWESITTANMMYIYTYNLLGPKPEDLGACSEENAASFADIVKKYGDDIPQFKITLEDHLVSAGNGLKFQPYNDIDAYFCVPENDKLNQYWDIVNDRQYKINNSLNIAGVKQPLLLFEPPLDPALLARAAASGGNPLSLLNQSGLLPNYRFEYLIEKTKSLAASLIQLGSTLLSAIERKDDSSLIRLQATQQSNLLNLTTLIKEKQIEQATQTIAGLQQNLLNAQNKEQFYLNNYNENINALEIASLALMVGAIYPETVSLGINGISVAGYLAPNIFGFADGGMKFGDAINAGAQMAQTASSILNQSASIISASAQFVRRRDDWLLQQQTSAFEAAEIQAQINGANAQLAIAVQELLVQKKSIQQQDDYEKFIVSKFTNTDLYVWMISSLSSVYFQTYQLTLDMALAAQLAYQNEMDNTDQFIQFDYWDSLHKGLLAGEGLMLSLEQMEKTYTLTNSRRLEIEKTVSLLHLDPQKFIEFKTGLNGGKCGTLVFKLSEQLFDFDFPGQYCRKIKSVSISIPAVVGPYQNINAMLRQTKNITVMQPLKAAVQYAMDPAHTPSPPAGSVRTDWIPNQKIALSRGVEDTGMFVLNFNDSLYLPFEGTGAVSEWELSIPPETNHFDFNSISDIIVRISYTALEDQGTFATDVKNLLTSASAPYPFMVGKQFILQQAFSAAWYQMMHPEPSPVTQQISFALTDQVILPHLKNVTLKSVMVFLLTAGNTVVSDKPDKNFLTYKNGEDKPITITNNFGTVTLDGALSAGMATLEFTIADTPAVLLTSDQTRLDPDQFTGLIFILNYTSNVFTTNQ